MTAKELRQAAEAVLADIAILQRANNEYKIGNEWCEESIQNETALARHILSTVRDDDDEPVSKEWFDEVIGDPLDLQTTEPWFIWWHSTRGLLMGPEGGSVGPEPLTLPIKTRGQFRALCVGLGIVLEDGT